MQAIWLIRLRDSNPGDPDTSGAVYTALFDCLRRRYWPKKGVRKRAAAARRCRGRTIERGRAAYVRSAPRAPWRLGFRRENAVELRKKGFLFMRQIDDTCARTSFFYSRTVTAFSPFLPSSFLTRPSAYFSFPHCGFSDRSVNSFCDGPSWNTPRNHDTFACKKSHGIDGGPSSFSAHHSDRFSELT